MTKLSILIAVFNEVNTIEKVLQQIKNLSIKGVTKEIIVVDDKSTDGTLKLLKNIKTKYVFNLIVHDINTGKGSSIRDALSVASGNIILFQDADLEYEISEYPELLKPILSKKAKFVIGSRHLQTGWKARKFLDSKIYAKLLNLGGVFYSKLFNFVYGVNITDPGSMYKVFDIKCLEGIKLRSRHFDIDWELAAKFIKKGITPIEVPISYKSRSPKEGKKIKFLRDGYLILWAIIKYRFIN